MELKPDIMRRLVITVVIAAVICISTQTGYAAAGPAISVEPSYLSVSQGDNFTVNITIDPDGTGVMGAEYKLYFNNVLLKALDQNKGTFLSQDGASTVDIANKIDNTAGRIEYGEMRIGATDGILTSGILATIEFEVRSSGSGELRLYDVILSDSGAQEIPGVIVNNSTVEIAQTQPSTPFVISGYVSYKDGSDCNDPAVNIETNESSNYYQIALASGADINAGEALQFNAMSPDGSQWNVTEHTVIQAEVDAGVFEYNIMLEFLLGDVNSDGEITSADAVIALQMAVCGERDSVADVNHDGSVTSLDALMIMQAAAGHITFDK
jgi:hypothetical protein